jgi:hypothetical protein
MVLSVCFDSGGDGHFCPSGERSSASLPAVLRQPQKAAELPSVTGKSARPHTTSSYLTTPSSGELAVAYSFLGIRPAR